MAGHCLRHPWHQPSELKRGRCYCSLPALSSLRLLLAYLPEALSFALLWLCCACNQTQTCIEQQGTTGSWRAVCSLPTVTQLLVISSAQCRNRFGLHAPRCWAEGDSREQVSHFAILQDHNSALAAIEHRLTAPAPQFALPEASLTALSAMQVRISVLLLTEGPASFCSVSRVRTHNILSGFQPCVGGQSRRPVRCQAAGG